jgi:CRP-like cAMP-binding protein
MESPRSATVRAATASRLLRLPGDTLRQLLGAHPACTRGMMAILDRRIRRTQALRDVQLTDDAPQQRLSHISLTDALDLTEIIPLISFLRRVDLFAELPVPTLTRLAGIVEAVEHGTGEELFEQGDPGDALYLIQSGEVDIIVDDRKVASLGTNSCLGEMALIGCTARSATVRVAADARLLRLGSEDFSQLLATEPEVSLALLKTLALRLHQVSRMDRAE